jgi:hypothetical protein
MSTVQYSTAEPLRGCGEWPPPRLQDEARNEQVTPKVEMG